jgi:hypothetical protein
VPLAHGVWGLAVGVEVDHRAVEWVRLG